MLELERERLERQKRIEDAVTAVYVAIDRRALAEAAVVDADHQVGSALGAILDEGVDVKRVAALCDLTPTDVRRLTRVAYAGTERSPRRTGDDRTAADGNADGNAARNRETITDGERHKW